MKRNFLRRAAAPLLALSLIFSLALPASLNLELINVAGVVGHCALCVSLHDLELRVICR